MDSRRRVTTILIALLAAGAFGAAAAPPQLPIPKSPVGPWHREARPVGDEPTLRGPVSLYGLSLIGGARVTAHVDESGTVTRVEVGDSTAQVAGAELAVEAEVSSWTFLPALEGGHPVSSTYESLVRFELPETLPATRIYRATAEEVVEALREVLTSLGTRSRFDKSAGVVSAKLTARDIEDLPGFPGGSSGGESVIRHVALEFLVSSYARPATVHAMAETTYQKGGREFRSIGRWPIEEWILRRVDRALDQPPRRLPRMLKPRMELRMSLLPEEDPFRASCAPLLQPMGDIQEFVSPALKDVTQPEIIEKTRISPTYPARLQGKAKEGSVRLMAVILEDGAVSAPRPVRPDLQSEFHKAAIQALRRWRYRPAMRRGCPVPIQFLINVNYRLD